MNIEIMRFWDDLNNFLTVTKYGEKDISINLWIDLSPIRRSEIFY